MTTISNINIVVQQGDAAKDAQNIKTQPLDPKQVTFSQQQEKETEQRKTVHESEEKEKISPDQERQDSRKRDSKKEGKKEDVNKGKEVESDPEATGRILDTIA